MGLFDVFKKAEDRYGRDNYVNDPANYTVNEKNWMLLLSASLVEGADINLKIGKAKHDCLTVYLEDLGDKKQDIKNYIGIEKPSDLEVMVDRLKECWPNYYERCLYRVLNAKDHTAVEQINKDHYENNPDTKKFLSSIWFDRKDYYEVRFRLYAAASAGDSIRFACYLGVIDEATAWRLLAEVTELVRPSLSSFETWAEYYDCIKTCSKLANFRNYNINDALKKSTKCLSNLEQSPIHKIPYTTGLDPTVNPERYKAFSYKKIEQKGLTLVGVDHCYPLFKAEDKQPLWDELAVLTKTLETKRVGAFLGDCIEKVGMVEEDVLELPDLYPDVAYTYLLRSKVYASKGYEARGSGTADQVGDENYKLFYAHMNDCMQDLWKAYELEPDNAVIWGDLLNILPHYDSESPDGDYQQLLKRVAEERPDDLWCVNPIIQYRAEKWGGSHDETFAWARNAIAAEGEKGINGALLFMAIHEYWFWFNRFENDDEKAEAVLNDEALKQELNGLFDKLIENLDEGPMMVSSYLLPWYFKTNDLVRFRQIVQRMEKGRYSVDPFYQYFNEDYIDMVMTWGESV